MASLIVSYNIQSYVINSLTQINTFGDIISFKCNLNHSRACTDTREERRKTSDTRKLRKEGGRKYNVEIQTGDTVKTPGVILSLS